ncbi:hypothetical protein B0H14DRAFT_3555226 [Mycena olivaceomarginata]|nr:hypothetical protein B0H14DRAFT_3555226 [Mycena olivaceomarginata]
MYGRKAGATRVHPEIPAQLQSSPQVTVAAPPTSLFPPAVQSHLQSPIRPSSCPATPSPHALRTFRALTLSRSRGLRHTASEVNGYVDAVTQEHEKERERLRRARERDGGSPRLGRANTSGTVATTATPVPIPPATPQSASASVTVPTPVPRSVAGPSQQPNQAPSTFHPSPPQADPPFVVPLDEIGRRLWSRISHPSVAPTPVTLPPAVVPAEMQPPPQIPQAQGFDPFDSQSYMDIDPAMNDFGGMGGMIDMGMGINFGMGGGGDDRQRASAMDFKTDFTDDDFSFFDRPPDVVPSAPLRMPSGVPSTSMLPELHPGAGLTPAAAGVHQCGAVPSAIGVERPERDRWWPCVHNHIRHLLPAALLKIPVDVSARHPPPHLADEHLPAILPPPSAVHKEASAPRNMQSKLRLEEGEPVHPHAQIQRKQRALHVSVRDVDEHQRSAGRGCRRRYRESGNMCAAAGRDNAAGDTAAHRYTPNPEPGVIAALLTARCAAGCKDHSRKFEGALGNGRCIRVPAFGKGHTLPSTPSPSLSACTLPIPHPIQHHRIVLHHTEALLAFEEEEEDLRGRGGRTRWAMDTRANADSGGARPHSSSASLHPLHFSRIPVVMEMMRQCRMRFERERRQVGVVKGADKGGVGATEIVSKGYIQVLCGSPEFQATSSGDGPARWTEDTERCALMGKERRGHGQRPVMKSCAGFILVTTRLRDGTSLRVVAGGHPSTRKVAFIEGRLTAVTPANDGLWAEALGDDRLAETETVQSQCRLGNAKQGRRSMKDAISLIGRNFVFWRLKRQKGGLPHLCSVEPRQSNSPSGLALWFRLRESARRMTKKQRPENNSQYAAKERKRKKDTHTHLVPIKNAGYMGIALPCGRVWSITAEVRPEIKRGSERGVGSGGSWYNNTFATQIQTQPSNARKRIARLPMGTGRNRKYTELINATGGTGKKTLRNKARRNRFSRFSATFGLGVSTKYWSHYSPFCLADLRELL